MTNSDIVREMLKMQKKLDVAIFEKAGMKAYPKPEQYFLAILDEVGELNHEMKPKWCWWKANSGKVDKEKQLEELVDVWHFVLSFANSAEINPNEIDIKFVFGDTLRDFVGVLKHATTIDYAMDLIVSLAGLTQYLDFDMSQVYDMYVKKNRINHERAEGDY